MKALVRCHFMLQIIDAFIMCNEFRNSFCCVCFHLLSQCFLSLSHTHMRTQSHNHTHQQGHKLFARPTDRKNNLGQQRMLSENLQLRIIIKSKIGAVNMNTFHRGHSLLGNCIFSIPTNCMCSTMISRQTRKTLIQMMDFTRIYLWWPSWGDFFFVTGAFREHTASGRIFNAN